MIAHLISLPKTAVNFCKWTMESKIPGGILILVLFSNLIYVTYCHLACFLHLQLFLCGCKFDFLWVVAKFFEVVVYCCRWLLVVPSFSNYAKRGEQVTLDGRQVDFVRVSRTNFNKIHFTLTLLAAFSRTFSKIHESRMSVFFFLFARYIFAFVTRHA